MKAVACTVMALMIGTLMIHNIQPGPQVMTRNQDLFWGLIASMWLGNFILVVLNLSLIGRQAPRENLLKNREYMI